LTHLLLLAAFAAPTCYSQLLAGPVTLRETARIPVPSLRLESAGFRTVAGDKSFYVQTDHGKYTAVDLQGNTHLAFDVAMIPPNDSVSPTDIFLADLAEVPRGGVLALVAWSPTPEKTRFGIECVDEDRDYAPIVWLDVDFIPTHAAEFSIAGDFLVSGYSNDGSIHVALFDHRGNLSIAQVLKEHDAMGGAAGKQTSEQKNEVIDRAAREAGLMQVVSGNDDSIYVYNPSWGRRVANVRSGGKVTEIKLASPRSENTLPMELFASNSFLCLTEAELDPGRNSNAPTELTKFLISSYDRFSGALIASYQIRDSFGANPVAASPREFDFLDAKVISNGTVSFSIIRAQP
jgi:hypothetical protein